MTTAEPSIAATAHYDTGHMRAIEAGLAACGLTTRLTDGRAGLDLTATPSPARMHGAEFWMDEDGYAELHFWYPPAHHRPKLPPRRCAPFMPSPN
jgi:hypothetical protein